MKGKLGKLLWLAFKASLYYGFLKLIFVFILLLKIYFVNVILCYLT